MGLLGLKKKSKHKSKDKEDFRNSVLSSEQLNEHLSLHSQLATQSDPLDLSAAQVISALESYGLQYDAKRARHLLRGRFCAGDCNKAIVLAIVLRDAEDMIVIEPTATFLQGAENVRGTTCYLDALLFSMFSRSFPIFDTLLYHPGADAKANRLIVHLRVFVNLLRTGHLITHDLVDMLRGSIADCGWEDARSSEQQDTSECFGFVADMLRMPTLTFKVHIAHGGKEDASADHKIVQERFLALSIPEPKSRHGVIEPLELVDLIDRHFHTKLEVRRPVARSRSTMTNSFSMANPALDGLLSEASAPRPSSKLSSTNPFRRSAPLNANGFPIDQKPRIDSRTREVSMQAWQLFELVPYYSAADESAQQQDFAKQPPVVAICLKRYYFDGTGTALINPTPVIIPEFIDFTPFTSTDNTIGRSGKHIRLRLESAVCHRGRHVGSGHYVSVSRGDAPGQWLLFDDLAPQRVTQGTFEHLFSIEIPYLLFYQLETVRPPNPNRRLPSIPNFLRERTATQAEQVIDGRLVNRPKDLPPYPLDPEDEVEELYIPPRPQTQAPVVPNHSKPALR